MGPIEQQYPWWRNSRRPDVGATLTVHTVCASVDDGVQKSWSHRSQHSPSAGHLHPSPAHRRRRTHRYQSRPILQLDFDTVPANLALISGRPLDTSELTHMFIAQFSRRRLRKRPLDKVVHVLISGHLKTCSWLSYLRGGKAAEW
jgi:hypothetical protein